MLRNPEGDMVSQMFTLLKWGRGGVQEGLEIVT